MFAQVMGADQGLTAIPAHLKEGLVDWDRYDKLLSSLPLLKTGQSVRDEL